MVYHLQLPLVKNVVTMKINWKKIFKFVICGLSEGKEGFSTRDNLKKCNKGHRSKEKYVQSWKLKDISNIPF